MPNHQARQVHTAQVPPPKPQQVDHIARSIALLRCWLVAPTVEQPQQQRIRSATAVPLEFLEDWQTDQALLTVPHVLFGLRLDEWLMHKLQRPSKHDLFAHFLSK